MAVTDLTESQKSRAHLESDYVILVSDDTGSWAHQFGYPIWKAEF
jgi:hypothetical protein